MSTTNPRAGTPPLATDDREHLRLVVEATPIAIVAVDNRGQITLANAQAQLMFGYDAVELIGKSVDALVPERFRGGHPVLREGYSAEPTTRAMGAGRDLFGLRKDGTEVPIEIGLNPISTPQGDFVLASIIDITERKHGEEQLRLVVEAAPNAMILADAGGRITLVNSAAERMFGYARHELLGSSVDALVPKSFRGGHPNLREGYAAAPTTRAMGAGRDLFGLRKDGTEVPIEIGLNPISTPQGEFVLASIIDITERKHSEEQLRLVVEAAPNAMILTDAAGRITLVNTATERMFGYGRHELLGTSVDALVPERLRGGHPDLRNGYSSAPTTRAMGAGRDLFGLRKDGREVPIEIGLNPITTGRGNFVLASIIDITERKHAEELRLANAGMTRHTVELEALNAELESFSYSVSHDLRAPVRAVIGYSRAIEEDYGAALDGEGRRLLSVVQSEAARMGELIDDLLAFSRLGRQPMERTPVNMTSLVRDVAAAQAQLAGTPASIIEIDDLPGVLGDRGLLRQVWTNLLSNGIKYSSKRHDPRLHVWATPDVEHVEFHVRDNGVGFDMQYAGKLFGVFQRLHRSDEFPGTGVGLAIVQRIVHRHGGTVSAQGALGNGAVFTFRLPRGGPE